MTEFKYSSLNGHISTETTSPEEFLESALHYWNFRSLKKKEWSRSPTKNGHLFQVTNYYNALRSWEEDHIDEVLWEDVIYGIDVGGIKDFVLIDDEIVWSSYIKPREFLLDRLEESVRSCVLPGEVVIEFGSGDGRNLLYLKSRFPEMYFFGVEVSPDSVRVSKLLAEKFGLQIGFYEFDVCKPLEAVPGELKVGLVFSCHALELMPRVFVIAVINMCNISKHHIKFFEPIPEMWPPDFRCDVSRLRAQELDRLFGLPETLEGLEAKSNWKIVSKHRLGTAHNPLNETCEIHLSKEN